MAPLRVHHQYFCQLYHGIQIMNWVVLIKLSYAQHENNDNEEKENNNTEMHSQSDDKVS